MDKNKPTNHSPSDEIDLGQLFQMIGKGFQKLSISFLRGFIYLKKNILILGGLAFIGMAIGFGLNQITTKRLKTEVIVKPNMETKNYLYDVVNEIQANINAGNSKYFEAIGVNFENSNGYKIKIEPASEEPDKTNIQDDLKYLELLQKFQREGFISDVVRTEILNKSSLNHRITFYYKDAEKGNDFSQKLIAYINSNSYFNSLMEVYRKNARERIDQDLKLVDQIDGLIYKFSDQLSRTDGRSDQGRIVLDDEEQLDITGLLNLKNNLIKDIESKRLELQEQKTAISVINFGNAQQVQKVFFGKNIILFPSILIGLFFLVSFIKYLNRKAAEMKV